MSHTTTSAEAVKALQEREKNARGIPRAPFIADVEQHVGGPDAEVETPLIRLQDALAKYRYMESNLTQRKAAVEEKIPDIKKTLAMVEFLKEHREEKTEKDEEELEGTDGSDTKKLARMRTTFELIDTLFAEAELDDTDEVYLWLGANVMLAYKHSDAIELVGSKLAVAEQNLANHIADLEYIKEQITIMEVNIARLFNWDVKRRRMKREKETVAPR